MSAKCNYKAARVYHKLTYQICMQIALGRNDLQLKESKEDTETVLVEKSVDLWGRKGREDESLPVEPTPAVQRPHTHTREVNTMRLPGLPMKVLENMLRVREGGREGGGEGREGRGGEGGEGREGREGREGGEGREGRVSIEKGREEGTGRDHGERERGRDHGGMCSGVCSIPPESTK